MSAPGWYPDPGGKPMQRYFDGTVWTEQYAPVSVAAAPARKGTHPIVWVLFGVIGVMVLGFGGCVALVGSAFSEQDGSPSSSAAATAGMNEPVSDGKFTFTVTDAKVMPYIGATARGEWFVVTMNVRNTGSEPQSFFVQNQKLLAGGTEYAADSSASYEVNGGNTMVFDLNPGFDITVKVPFDVPRGTAPDKVELHDSAFSQGVTVKLS